MRTQKVKLTKFVSINLPLLPNFLIHENGRTHEVVPVHLFSASELRKVGVAWTRALIAHGAKRPKKKSVT